MQSKMYFKKSFLKCGTCSQAVFHLLNNEFKNNLKLEEKAADPFAGGLLRKGYQCGMLWGAALAIGYQSANTIKNDNEAIITSTETTILMQNSFIERANSADCKDISECDFENKFSFIKFMLKTITSGFIFSKCFNLLANWMPDALQTINNGFAKSYYNDISTFNCAVQAVIKAEATREEAIAVSGFAGGLGLSGNVCGALGAIIYISSLRLLKHNPEIDFSQTNKELDKIIFSFLEITNGEFLCKNITKCKFNSIEEHSNYLSCGGCKNLIDKLAKLSVY